MKTGESKRYFTIIILVACGILSCLFGLTKLSLAKEKTPENWPTRMREIEKVFQELLVDLNSDDRFNSPKNYKRIQKNADSLSKLAHSLKTKEVQPPDMDPSIQLIASLFAEEATHASQTLYAGYRPYARKVLKSMTSYCIACHTRSNSGPGFQFIASQAPAFVDQLKDIEKAEYFSSVRQFDRSLEEYEKLVKDAKFAAADPFAWERAIQTGVAIAVRVKKSPDQAMAILDQAMSTKRAPLFLRELTSQWRQSLVAWKAEKPFQGKTEDELFAEANRLIAAARAAQKFPADRSADILYLRASSVIHEELGSAPNGKYATEALYLAGICYEVLENMSLNEMSEFYYLACISKSPHTENARQCFQRYEESVYLGYTGSSGTHIPARVRDRLDRLDLLSNPIEAKTAEKRRLE